MAGLQEFDLKSAEAMGWKERPNTALFVLVNQDDFTWIMHSSDPLRANSEHGSIRPGYAHVDLGWYTLQVETEGSV